MFRKRATSKKSRRQRDSTSDDESAAACSRAAEIRADQRDRRRGAGIDPAALVEGAHGRGSQAAADAAAEEDDKIRVKAFKATDRIGGAEQIAHEDLMEKYIDERLGLRREGGSPSGAGAAPAALSDKDRLYEIPAHLRVASSVVAPGGAEEDGMGAQGSAIAWNSGIAEVELPASEKLRNIQRTREAVQRLEAQEKVGRSGGGAGADPDGTDGAAAAAKGGSGGHRKRQEASDVRVMQNFKKRLRR